MELEENSRETVQQHFGHRQKQRDGHFLKIVNYLFSKVPLKL